jgi:protein TonB
MFKAFGISIGLHTLAVVSVFSLVTPAETDLERDDSGTVTITFRGNVTEKRQVTRVEADPESAYEPQTKPEATVKETAESVEDVRSRVTQVAEIDAEKQNNESESHERQVSGSGAHQVAVRNIHCPAPVYPHLARRSGIEGKVKVDVVIDEKGGVVSATVMESSGRRDFDMAACRTIKREWRYQPAEKWGRAVSSQESVMIEYRLD